MIVVIIAGGAGTRLWPLSTSEFPKHLLSINGDDKSILRHTYERAKQLTDKIYVASDKSHISKVKAQLSELGKQHFLVEPGRRGTANSIVAVLAKLSSVEDLDEPIAFIHADHFIRDVNGFVHSFEAAVNVSAIEHKIVLVGVEPSYPATGFGYIEKGALWDKEHFIYRVASFSEKPDFSTAKDYLKKGNYLWNCGYFIGSLNTFIYKMKKYAPKLFSSYTNLCQSGKNFDKTYLRLESEAIDYALIEKVEDLLVLPAGFDWMDIGSYTDLLKAVVSDENGNFVNGNVLTSEVNNSYIDNKDAKPLAVIGIDNCVVVNTKDGILVARKDLSQKIGDIAKIIASREESK